MGGEKFKDNGGLSSMCDDDVCCGYSGSCGSFLAMIGKLSANGDIKVLVRGTLPTTDL